MRFSTRLTGFSEVREMLRSVGEKVPDVARGMMKRSANRIVKQAKINTPEESGALVESIRIEKSYGTRGRLQIDIVAGGLPELESYALLVHEDYEGSVAYVNGPGPRTREKMAANPNAIIGSGVLSRDYEQERDNLIQRMMEMVNEVIRTENRT